MSSKLIRLANKFLRVLAEDDTSSTFIVEIVTVDPKQQRLAMLSFMNQLERSSYRTMIKYVQDRRNDSSILIAFKEPVSKETVLAICKSLSLSFSRYDDDSFLMGGEEQLIVIDIDVESYIIHPIKEALRFTIDTSSVEDASALAEELNKFQRIQSTHANGNVVQVTFKESADVGILRGMCEKLSRLYLKVNRIDIGSLTIKEV